jgi:hypothetical protein
VPRRERQRAVVGEQDDGGLGELARERAVLRRSMSSVSVGHRPATRGPVGVEQAELGLLAQHRAARRGRPSSSGTAPATRRERSP